VAWGGLVGEQPWDWDRENLESACSSVCLLWLSYPHAWHCVFASMFCEMLDVLGGGRVCRDMGYGIWDIEAARVGNE